MKFLHSIPVIAVLLIALLSFSSVRAGDDDGYWDKYEDDKDDDKRYDVRVRKEIRSLSAEEFRLFVKGVATMMSLSTEAGQKLYGPKFKEYDYFVVKHVVTVYDSRGDQGHAGPSFVSFHRAMLLEFENSVLSVVPELKAVPYWDVTLDMKGGKYYNDAKKGIWTENYAGLLGVQNADKDYRVKTGAFAWRQIHQWRKEKWGSTSDTYSGATVSGLIRGRNSQYSDPTLLRFPFAPVANSLPFTSQFLFGPYAPLASSTWTPSFQKGLEIGITTKDVKKCTNPDNYATWVDVHCCFDFTTFAYSQPTGGAFDKYTSITTPLLHIFPHLFAGGSDPDCTAPGPDVCAGDFTDVSASPNDAMLFMPHHANMDRIVMTWQKKAQKKDPSIASKDVMWYYPKKVSDYPGPWPNGTYLNDVISDKFPTTDIFSKPPKGVGYTHYEVIDYTRPGQGPYTYDTLKKNSW